MNENTSADDFEPIDPGAAPAPTAEADAKEPTGRTTRRLKRNVMRRSLRHKA